MALSRLEYLFECYVSHRCSDAEEKEFMAMLVRPENEPIVKKLIEKVIERTGSEIKIPTQSAVSILQNILQKDKAKVVTFKSRKRIIKIWVRVAAAAVVILFISGISYRILTKEYKGKMTASAVPSEKNQAILPGGNHAILTMADGSTIVLDSVQNGNLQRGNVTLKKQNGLLVYDGSTRSKPGEAVTYNTLTTPRGGQYQVVLPDGSKVWLNAASSLRYPTTLIGESREVELTGEAYFEVAPLNRKGASGKIPFMVKILSESGQDMGTVRVLGTHFDINAYADEGDIKTSLMEGSVKLTSGAASRLLKPGQQGVIEEDKSNIEIRNADMEEVIAWKNGLFQFDGADIKTIMRQISRWYNVGITYSGNVPVRSFAGKISRDAQLTDVLKILELSDVKFNVEGKEIIVQ
jgi:hypothetical protein